MLYICIFSNKLDLIQATSVFSYSVFVTSAILTHFRQGMEKAYTLAYFAVIFITVVKGFIAQGTREKLTVAATPETKQLKLFSPKL